MGLFDFWKSKAEKHSLEQLVNSFNELKEEFKAKNAELKREADEQRARAEEAERKLREEAEKASIIVHYYPGKELFVVLNGEIIHSEDVSQSRYKQIMQLRQEKDAIGIKKLLIPNIQIESEVQKQIKKDLEDEKVSKEIEETVDNVRLLVSTGDFVIKGDTVQMKGINRSLPRELLEKFIELHINDEKERYESYKNFWRWLVLNPNAQAVEDLYGMIKRYDPVISQEGFILAFRWVVPKDQDAKEKNEKRILAEFISNSFLKVKKWKKGTKNYNVWRAPAVVDQDGFHDNVEKKYKIERTDKTVQYGELIGNLEELYLNLSNLQDKKTYTDDRTKSMSIRIGEEVTLPRSACDESRASCSRGLHACFNLNDYSNSFGSVKMMIAICPRDIVSVPYDNSKFRTCSYLPVGVIPENESQEEFIASSAATDILEHYFEFKLDELTEQAETKTVKELTVQRLLPERLNELEAVVADTEVSTIISQLVGRIKSIG